MKKFIIFLLLSLAILSGCSAEQETNQNFIGEVTDRYEGSYTLVILQGEILSSGDLVNISSDLNYQIGDLLEVEHSNQVMESYPLQVNVISINMVLATGSITAIDGNLIEITENNLINSYEVATTKDFTTGDFVYVVKRESSSYLVEIK
jgi:uncharacterized lipoprotein